MSLSVPPRYFDGLLAATRPGYRCAAAVEPPETAGPDAPSGDPAETLPEAERIKRALHPLDSFPRLLDCAEGDRPPVLDDAFRFQWFGLFYQGPRQDAFTVRLRLPGGRLQAFQLAGLAEILQDHAGGQVLLDVRGGLDIPGVPVRSAVEILRRIEGIGLSARQTGGDCVRRVRGGEGRGAQAEPGNAPAIYPVVCVLEQALSCHRVLADLPRGCEIALVEAGGMAAVEDAAGTDLLVLQAVAEPAPAFFLRLPGQGEKDGWLIPRPVTACLRLLEAWATRAVRAGSEQQQGLATFLCAIGPEEISALLGGAQRQPAPPRDKPAAPESAGLPLPGERLLSGQLAALATALQRENLPGICLADGRLHPAPRAGGTSEGWEVLAQALA